MGGLNLWLLRTDILAINHCRLLVTFYFSYNYSIYRTQQTDHYFAARQRHGQLLRQPASFQVNKQ